MRVTIENEDNGITPFLDIQIKKTSIAHITWVESRLEQDITKTSIRTIYSQRK